MTGKKDSLQTLRAIAFCGIFLSHCNIIPRLGSWGTSVFFVLSGFLMAYNYKSRICEKEVTLKYCLKFGVRRILKIYPLHVLVTFASVPLELVLGGTSLENIGLLVNKVFLHLFLLHSWVPSSDYYFSLNSVDWYLSVSLFLYIVFPILFIRTRKESVSRRMTKAIIVFLLMVLFVTFVNLFVPNRFGMIAYFSYVFPVLRLGDFYLGIILGLCVLDAKSKERTVNYHLIEILLLCLTVLSIVICNKEYSNPILSALTTSTIIYLPTILALVYVFYTDKGILTKLINNRITVLIGNSSPYGYLIHQKIFSYVMVTIFYTFGIVNDYITCLASVGIMCLLIPLYRTLEKKILPKTFQFFDSTFKIV